MHSGPTSSVSTALHWPRGSLSTDSAALDLTPERAGWSWASLRVVVLEPGGAVTIESQEEELLVLPLEGSFTVTCGAEQFELAGRLGVFAGATDFAYLGRHCAAAISTLNGGRVAIPGAPALRDLPCRYAPASDVAVELRGAGSCSRQVNNLCLPGSFEADRLMVCEVLTPGGNWSSFPPHKHDESRPGESELEEIYYFEIADGPTGPGLAYQRVYGTPARPIDVLAEVRSGDLVLVPHGWHGPSMAAPGYDLYYLNVMAGPGERAWLICDDPSHAWVRSTWDAQEIDARLPFYVAPTTGAL
jgi:5-deoxy-glucuronate isomerase